MAYIADGYANRVLSTRLSSEHPEGPEEESWYREFNVPFGGKRTGGQAFDNQGTHSGMEFTSPRYQSVPPLPAANQWSAQYAASEAGPLGRISQPSPQGPQRFPQGIQHSSQGFPRSSQGLQPSPMEARPNIIPQTGVQPRSETGFGNAANIQTFPAAKRTWPFIFDEDEDVIGLPENLIINTNTRNSTATTSQIPASTINFARGRLGSRPLTFGLDDPPDRKIDADSRARKNRSGVRKSKKADDAVLGEVQKQAEAYAKIKEKEDMAAKAKDINALFEEPVNEAAQARIQTSIQKDEMHRRELEVKRKFMQAMAEELEIMKKENADRENAQKEAERAERASRKSKSQEERDAIQMMREAEEKKRLDERRREAEELLLQKRQEQIEREAAAREKEAATESKRQQDGENLKKFLATSRIAATSLKAAKRGQCGREENGEKATTAEIETLDLTADDGGLFVPEQVVVEPSDETKSTNRKQRAKSIQDRRSDKGDTWLGRTFSSSACRLEGARKANTETKVASIFLEHHKEKLSEDQRLRDEASVQERARERTELKRDFAVLFEKLASTLAGQVQGELKVAVDKILNVRPPAIPMNSWSGSTPVRGTTVSPKKYASETQCFLGRKTTKLPKELAPPGEKSSSDSDARRRDKEEMRLVEKARKRFEVKLRRENEEQSRPMSEYAFRSHIERQKDYQEKREKKLEKDMRMMPHGGQSAQGQARFGYEDIDFNEVNSHRPNKYNTQSEKGRCGGVMARLRESNGSLGNFKKAASARMVDGGINYLGDDADSESEVSEEDPDDDEPESTPVSQPKVAVHSYSRDRASDITATEPDRTAANSESFGVDRKDTQLIKPRHLQDKEMVYIFSVQRSEIRDQEKSLPITIKQFFDRDDANEFAEEELRRTRWGPSMPRPQITQSYSEEKGLFNGRAVIDSEDNMVECVDVVAQAQYIGDLDDFEHEKIKVKFRSKLYLIFKSITKMVQAPIGSCDDEASENEEADQNEVTEQNTEIDRNRLEEHTTETDTIGETEQSMQKNKICDAGQTMETDHNDNGAFDDRKSESTREPGGEAIDSLFEGEDEEAEVELRDNSGHTLAAHVHQMSLDSAASCGTGPEMTLAQTSKPLEVYTDRELANKRASEIFLEQIRPVGGDISQLVAFQNDAVKPVRESLEEHNRSGELFLASNDYANNGEEVRVWVEDFEIKGPLN
ncbi:hypothetical protein ACLOAV_002999 [Pseudogymnoascus australis]